MHSVTMVNFEKSNLRFMMMVYVVVIFFLLPKSLKINLLLIYDKSTCCFVAFAFFF